MSYVPERLQPFHRMIQAYFDVRRTAETLSALYLEIDPVWQCNGWTAGLLEKLLVEIHKQNPSVTREDLRRRDVLAAGHSDWHRRLALSCAELSEAGCHVS